MARRTLTKLLAAVFLASLCAWAQDEEVPGRGVARLSLINGDVSVRRGDSGDWMAGAVNTPLVVPDRVLTGAASRAEVQLDWANMLRLAANTEVRLSELEQQRYQVQVARGTVMLSVLRDSSAEVEVNTPNVSVRPVKKGLYRITVREDGQTEVTVRAGEAEAFTPRGVERIGSGRAMLVRGTSSDPEFQTVRAIAEDDWDRWNENRNRALERTRSYQYVSRDIYGADDLDANGRWNYDAPYGWVWSPYGAGRDWAPYRYGRWTWIDWYGWSWLSYDPWGWAPFHYGRWYQHANWGWCWYPGYIGQHHWWRPGLVGFFGWGGYSGLHAGIGFGNVGWVPLAPYESFYPWYGHRYYSGYRSRTYVDNSVHIVNNVNITNVYRNARVANGVSGIDSGEFIRGRAARAIQVSEAHFDRASVVRGALPMTPTADSLRFSDRTVNGANLPRGSDSTRFYTRRQAATVDHVPFEQQRQGMEQMVRRTFGGPAAQPAETAGSGNLPRTGVERGAARGESGNLSRVEAGGTTRAVERTQSGWRRIGEQPQQPRTASPQEPAARAATPETGRVERRAEQPARGAGASQESWRRFGSPTAQPERSAPVERGAEPSTVRPTPDQGSVRRESDQGWSRFATGRRSSPEAESSPQMSAPRSQTRGGAEPRSESPRWSTPRSQEPVRINPPIVRERSTPRYESPQRESPGASTRRSEASGGEIRRGGGEARSGGEVGGGGASRSESRGGTSRAEGGRGRNR